MSNLPPTLVSAACPRCGAALAPTTATLGTVLVCPACQAAVSLVLRPARAGLTLEAALTPPRPVQLPGDLARRFEVVARLGAGGQGEVLRVRPRGATRDYALKWTRVTDGAVDRGPREANYAALPPHPNVLAPIQAGWFENFQYMVFDLVEGETLDDVLQRERPLDPARAADFAHQILRALAHVHANSVIHRDVKPANLLLAQDGTLRLTDFGIATSVGTPPGDDVVGTPTYISPEAVAQDPPLPASDVYSFGCVLFEMLAGRPPFQRDALVDMMVARLNEPAPDVRAFSPACPEPLAALTARCLARRAVERPRDGADALAALAAAQRACTLEEHVNLPAVPLASDHATALDRKLVRARLNGPLSLVAASALAFALALYAGHTSRELLFWPAILAASALLAHGFSGLSRPLLGDAEAWWRAYLPGEHLDWRELAPRIVGVLLALLIAMLMLLGYPMGMRLMVAIFAWVAVAVAGGLQVYPTLADLSAPPPAVLAAAPPELRVYVQQDGWQYRVLPDGQELPLPHRLPLEEGVNRLEVWRTGGRRRRFVLWGEPGKQLALRLRDAADGPAVSGEGRPLLPPPT